MEYKKLSEETLRCLSLAFAQPFLLKACKSYNITPTGQCQPLHLRVRMGEDKIRSSLNAYGIEGVDSDGKEWLVVSDMYEINAARFAMVDFKNDVHSKEVITAPFTISSITVKPNKDANGLLKFTPVYPKKK